MKPLRAALLVHVAFFTLWGGYLLTAHSGGRVIWLDTVPIDPRDLISGHYVALNYPINTPTDSSCAGALAGAAAKTFVRLRPSGARVNAGTIELWHAVECADSPRDDGEVWAAAALDRGNWRTRLIYGIERFYVNENSSLRTAQTGTVVARVSANGRELRILDLVARSP